MIIMAITALDYIIILIISIVMMIGGYQFYFWTQRHVFFKKHRLLTFVDSWFGSHPIWVWVYAGLYYPFIVLTVLTINDFRHFNYVVFSYLILLFIQIIIFLLFPVELPPSWRKKLNGKSLSEKFLVLILTLDSQ